MGGVNVQQDVMSFIFKHKLHYFLPIITLPLNLLYCGILRLCNLNLFSKKPSAETHRKKTQHVQDQVRKWKSAGGKKKMCTARPKTHSIMYRTPKYRDTLYNIQVGDMGDILGIDVEKRVVKVEPMVSMGQLTAALIPCGWTIPVVPELEALTVGGLVMGGGIETSSHKYGLFHRTCRSYEIVTSNGEKITCSKDENSDLFYGIPFSYGTLGFLTAVEIEIIEAKRFVKIEYYPAHKFENAVTLLEKHSKNHSQNDFVEALTYSRNKWVIMVGKMVNSAEPSKINKIGRWYKKWFYTHVETFLTKGNDVEYIPTEDYFHRHTRCTFWLNSAVMPYANWAIFRYLLGWMLPVDMKFINTLLPDSLNMANFFVQDFLVPVSAISEIIDESEKQTKLYPLWICPFKMEADNGGGLWCSGRDEDEIFYDIGVYGLPEVINFDIHSATRKLEALVRKHKGLQVLYTDTYMTESQFRQMFDLRLYEILRKKYNAMDAFPDVYSKVSMKGRSEGL